MHHYPHHIGDYRTHTAHLTMVEDGAYRRLLDLYYMHERPLPADIAAVQRLASARTDDERAAVETVLREFFRPCSDGWHQGRADEEIQGYQARASKARENGQRGGRPKTQDKPSDNQSGYSSDTQAEPNEKLTVNREPLTNNQEDMTAPTGAGRATEEGKHVRRSKPAGRLPEDWTPSIDLQRYASDLGCDADTASAFADYWHAENSSKAVKRDWDAAFRTWCRREAERRSGPRGNPGFRPAHGDGGDAGAFARAAAILGRNQPVRE
jgi:uncharacterized protein YdaU (DUF1376 family)